MDVTPLVLSERRMRRWRRKQHCYAAWIKRSLDRDRVHHRLHLRLQRFGWLQWLPVLAHWQQQHDAVDIVDWRRVELIDVNEAATQRWPFAIDRKFVPGLLEVLSDEALHLGVDAAVVGFDIDAH